MATTGKGKLKIYFMISSVVTGRKESLVPAIESRLPNNNKKKSLIISSGTDIDEVITEKHDKVFFPDFAEKNLPGMKNRVRYQDAVDLMEKGIDVEGVLNIANVESQAEIAENLTGIPAAGIVPDLFAEKASSVIFLDNDADLHAAGESPSVLQKYRAAGGKGEREISPYPFLREMAFNYVAALVGRQHRYSFHTLGNERALKSRPGFLVAVSASPYSQFIIRWTQKSAAERNVPWAAVYIQTNNKLSDDENTQLKKNLDLVSELGAALFVSMDDDAVDGILRVANQHNISHIVIGKPLGYRRNLFAGRKNIVNALIRKSGEKDIFVISEQDTGRAGRLTGKHVRLFPVSMASDFLEVSLLLALLIGINLFLFRYISYLSVGFILLAAVSLIASRYPRGPVLYFASLSAVLWNYLFLQPRFTFYIDHLEDLFMFLMYFITAYIIGNLTTRLRIKDSFLRRREKNLEELYRMGRILNETNNPDDLLEKSLDLLRGIFSATMAIYLKDEDNRLRTDPGKGSDFKLENEDFDTVLQCFKNGITVMKDAGGTGKAGLLYVPLLTQSGPAGVLVIDRSASGSFTVDQENLFMSLVSQISIAIERSDYNRTWQRIKLAEESEKIYQLLLNSVSHELKTPITTISTAANGLIDSDLGGKPEIREIFANDIVDASERLNRIVDNLLGSLRIESNKSALNLEWYDISELAEVVQKKTARMMSSHRFSVQIESSISLLKFDFMLMEHLLTNLVYNAILYTPEDSIIELRIFSDGGNVVVSVNDSGPGIPEEEREKIFGRFYRSKGVRTGGLGLGLSICREIAEIHGGIIEAAASDLGGAAFNVRLPLMRSEIHGEL